jgi:cytosine/adenosine deaminase-related metal-dependent hydrolase
LWQGRPDAFGMATALRRATEDGARFLGRDDIGRLEPGGRADIAVWSGEDLADVPYALAGLVPGTRTVRCLLVVGEPVVTDGELLGVDLAAVRRTLATNARRLGHWPVEYCCLVVPWNPA